MPVDDFKYLPRSFVAGYQNQPIARADPIPFTPLRRPVNQSRFALVVEARGSCAPLGTPWSRP